MTRPGRAADVLAVVPDHVTLDPISLIETLSRLSVGGLARMYEPRTRKLAFLGLRRRPANGRDLSVPGD